MRRLIALLFLLPLLACETPPTLTLPSPSLAATATETATETALPSATETATATVTETASPTLTLTPTVTPTDTPTPDSSPSPTPISAQPTGVIIEVTPLGGSGPTMGVYTPNGTMNVRTCHATSCPVWGQIAGGVPVRTYDMYIDKDNGDTWLARDPAGNTWVALIINDVIYGTFIGD